MMNSDNEFEPTNDDLDTNNDTNVVESPDGTDGSTSFSDDIEHTIDEQGETDQEEQVFKVTEDASSEGPYLINTEGTPDEKYSDTRDDRIAELASDPAVQEIQLTEHVMDITFSDKRSGVDFDRAMEMSAEGACVARQGWKNKNVFITNISNLLKECRVNSKHTHDYFISDTDRKSVDWYVMDLPVGY